MAYNSIEDIRSSWGKSWGNASDEEVLQAYAKAAKLDPIQVANTLGYDAGDGGLTAKRISSGKDNYDASMYGLGQGIANAVGATGVRDWFQRQKNDNQFQADVADARAKELGAVDDWKNVHSAADAANYLGGAASTSLPYLAEQAAWALGDAATGGALTPAWLARAATTAPKLAGLGGAGLRAGESYAARKAALAEGKSIASATMGVGVNGYTAGVADILGNQRDQLNANGQDENNTRLGMALAGGVPYAVADVLDPVSRLASGRVPGRAVNLLDDVSGVKGGLARAAVNGTIAGVEGGLSETNQEFANQYFGHMAVDPNATMTSGDAISRYENSFAAGAGMGFVPGAGMGGWKRSQQFDDSAQRDLLTGQHAQELQGRANALTQPPAGADQYTAQALQDEQYQQELIPQSPQSVGLIRNAPVAQTAAETRNAQLTDEEQDAGYVHPSVVAAQAQQEQQANAQAQQQEQEAAKQDALRSMFGKYGEPTAGVIEGGTGDEHGWLGKTYPSRDDTRGAVDKQAEAENKRLNSYGSPPALMNQVENMYATAQRAQGKEVLPSTFTNKDFGNLVKGTQNVNQIVARLAAAITHEVQTGKATKLGNLQAFHEVLTGAPMALPESDTPTPTNPIDDAKARLQAQARTSTPATSTKSAPAGAVAPQPLGVTSTANQAIAPVGTAQTATEKVATKSQVALSPSLPKLSIPEDKRVTVGRSGRKQELSPSGLLQTIYNAPLVAKRRILEAAGWTLEPDPDTGEPRVLQAGAPLSFAEIARNEEERTGKSVSRQAVASMLQTYGLTEAVITKLASPGVPASVTESELGVTTSEDGADSAPGFRIEGSLAKATSEGLVQGGDAETVAQKQARVEANRILKTAPKAAEVEAAPVAAEGQVVTDLRDNNAAVRDANIRAALESDERVAAEADWDGSTPFSELPDTFKADWVFAYADTVKRTGGNFSSEDFQELAREQGAIEDEYAKYRKYHPDADTASRVSTSSEGARGSTVRDQVSGISPRTENSTGSEPTVIVKKRRVAVLPGNAKVALNNDAIGPGAAEAAAVNRDVAGAVHPLNEQDGVTQFATTPSAPANGGISVKEGQDTVDKALDALGLGSVVHIEVARNPEAIGISVPQGVVPTGGTRNGKVYLFTDNVADATEAFKTIFHELFHLGLSQSLTQGKYIQGMLKFLTDPMVRKYASEWKAGSDGQSRIGTMPVNNWNALAVEEALAKISEDLNTRRDGLGSKSQPSFVRNMARTLASIAQDWGLPKVAAAIRAMTYTQAEKFVQGTVLGAKTGAPVLLRETRFSSKAAPMPKSLSDTAQRLDGRTGNLLVDSAVHAAKKLGYSMLSLHDLVAEFKTKLPAVQDWYAGIQASVATRNKLEALAETIAAEAEKLPGLGKQKVSKFLALSTTTQKWGYDPKFAGKTTVVDPATEEEFKKLTQPERKIVQDVFQHGENMRVAQAALLKKLGATELFKGITPLDGPYAPLKRFGNYVAVGKSQKMLDLLATGTKAQIDALKQDPENYRVSYFDTMGQAQAFARENDVANGGNFVNPVAFEKSTRVNEQLNLNPNVLQKVLATIGADNANIPAEAKAAVTRMINDMYLQSIDEHSARANGEHRFGRAGFEEDMIRSFLAHARAQAGFLANMEHGGAINGAFVNMERQGRGEGNNPQYHGQDAFNMFAAHYAENLKTTDTPWQDRAMALTSAWQLSTSVGYHVTNATQGIMVSIPKLAADFNDYGGAWKHLMAGYKQLVDGGMWGNFDIAKVKDAGLRDALQTASDAGVLDVGMDENLTQFNAVRTGIAGVDTSSKLVRAVLHKLRRVSQTVELANRVAAATAGYNMALQHGRTVAQAQAYAVETLQSTQGDFSKTSAPLILKRLPKVMTQYRKYQFMMGALYAKAFRQAVWGSAEEKAIGRRMLGYKLFHASMAAGALGLPMMNLAAMAFSALGGDDKEPADLERSLRELIGDDNMANMLLHGPLAMMGLDMSSKLGEDNIFSIAPYAKFDLTSRKGALETVAGVMGPSTSLGLQFADSIGKFKNGDYYKGLEGFMPKGISQAMKASRIANEGFTLTNGDVMFKPEDINGFALTLDAMGLPSSELKRMSWIRSQQYEIGMFYKDRTNKIEQDYAKAVKGSDTEALPDLRQQWLDLQDGKRHMRKYFGDSQDALKHQAITTLLQYPANAAKREKKLQGTVPK